MQQQEHRACNCRNSKCLKLYCECFASGRYCSSCNCSNCMNNKEHEAARSKAVETILERNPNAFRPKIQYQQVRQYGNGQTFASAVRQVCESDSRHDRCMCVQGEDGAMTTQITRHSKGCSCRKSNCLKKYCECFQAGICCAKTCRCKDCRNFQGSEQLLAVMRREDQDATHRNSQSVRWHRSTKIPALHLLNTYFCMHAPCPALAA
jgi:protein lin-54